MKKQATTLVKAKRKKKAKSRSQSWLDQVEIDSMSLMASSSLTCAGCCGTCETAFWNAYDSSVDIYCYYTYYCWTNYTYTPLNNCLAPYQDGWNTGLEDTYVAWALCQVYCAEHSCVCTDPTTESGYSSSYPSC